MFSSIVVVDPAKAIIAAVVTAVIGMCIFLIRHLLRRRGEKGERK